MRNITTTSKITIITVIFLLICIVYFLKFEYQLAFINYLPETINKSIDYEFNGYKATVPLHKFTFIQNFDTSLKSFIKYVTFLNADEISKFYDMLIQYAEENYKKVYNVESVCVYFDEVNDTYVQIPNKFYIEEKYNFFRQVRFTLVDNETMKKIIENQ